MRARLKRSWNILAMYTGSTDVYTEWKKKNKLRVEKKLEKDERVLKKFCHDTEWDKEEGLVSG